MVDRLPMFKVFGVLGGANMFSFCPAVNAEEAEAYFRWRNPGVKEVHSIEVHDDTELAA